MADFFVETRSDAQVQGPFSGGQLRNLAKRDKLKPWRLVSQDRRVWRKVSAVKGLSSAVKSANGWTGGEQTVH